MTFYDPTIHHRQSIRLKGYDYSREGLYFITLLAKNRQHLFGEIINGEMHLNPAGKIAQQCWLEIPQHFPNVILHEYIIMPNHIHGIIEIKNENHHHKNHEVRANDLSKNNDQEINNNVRANNYSPRQEEQKPRQEEQKTPFKSPSKTIGSIIRGFKIGVTKWMRQNTSIKDVWQRNYYESIIRSDNAYTNISNYIKNNPKKWSEDKLKNK